MCPPDASIVGDERLGSEADRHQAGRIFSVAFPNPITDIRALTYIPAKRKSHSRAGNLDKIIGISTKIDI
jgi:hypothetical protein